MGKKRVVITGMGLVSCFGCDTSHFFQQLLEGKSGVVEIEEFQDTELTTTFGARVQDFSIEDVLDRKEARRIDPFIPFALSASRDALSNAQINLEAIDKTRAGVIIGSGMGGMRVFTQNARALVEKGHKKVSPFFIPYIIPNMAGGKVAIDCGFKGPNYPISTACASSNHSLIAAAEHIRAGHADVMIGGGVEAAINDLCFAGFCSLRALSRGPDPKTASKPWDIARDGFVVGEGAGVFILESLDHALERGAPILAEYYGGAINCDAHHITEPTPDGSDVARCIMLALQDSGITPDQVDYINAHATSTPPGDLCEMRAIKKVFGEHPEHLKVNATKSMIGHALGGAGALEMVATIQSIQHNRVHPTINTENPEEETHGVDLVLGKAQDHQVNVAISNSFGFGGHNAVVVVAKYQGA